MESKIQLNLSFHNLKTMVESLDLFREPNNRYAIIKPLKINEKRAVYLVKDMKDSNDTMKVLKFILMINVSDEQIEIYEFFKRINSKNFCRIESIEIVDRFLMIVQEYINGPSILDFFSSQSFNKHKGYRILFDLIRSIDKLHSFPVIHGDIKPDNILIRESDNSPVLIDYDLSKIENIKKTVKKPFGTPLYMSPELVLDCVFDLKTDVWSLGMTLYSCIIPINELRDPELSNLSSVVIGSLNSLAPFDFETIISHLNDNRERITRTYGHLFFNIVRAMLIRDYMCRPTASALKNIISKSRYFSQIYEVKN